MNNNPRFIENALQPGVDSGVVPNFSIISAAAVSTALPYPEYSVYPQTAYAQQGSNEGTGSFNPVMNQVLPLPPQFQQQIIAVPQDLTNQFNGPQQQSYGFYPASPIGQQILSNGPFYPEQMFTQGMTAENPYQNRQCSSPCFPQSNQGFFSSTLGNGTYPPQPTNYNFSQVFPNLDHPQNELSYQQFVVGLHQIPPATQFNIYDLRDISLLSPIPKPLPANQSMMPTSQQQAIASVGVPMPTQATQNPPFATNDTGQHLSIVRFEQTSQVTQFSSTVPKDANEVSSSPASASPNKSITCIQHKYTASPEGMMISTQTNDNEPQVISIGFHFADQTNHGSFFFLQHSINGPDGKVTTTCSPNVTIKEVLPKDNQVTEDSTQTDYEDSFEEVFSARSCSSDTSLYNQTHQTPGLTSIIKIDNPVASNHPLHLRISSIKESKLEEDEDSQVTGDEDENMAKKGKLGIPEAKEDSDESKILN